MEQSAAMLLPIALMMSAQVAGAETSPTAQTNDMYVISDQWADKSKCNSGNAKRVELAALTADSSALLGQCVIVKGYLSGRALFISKADSRDRYSQSVDTLKPRRVGLYGLGKELSVTPPKPGSYEVVGTVGDCQQLDRVAIMVLGYCHYTSGPYLAVSVVQPAK